MMRNSTNSALKSIVHGNSSTVGSVYEDGNQGSVFRPLTAPLFKKEIQKQSVQEISKEGLSAHLQQ
jgi:hypothetical protein